MLLPYVSDGQLKQDAGGEALHLHYASSHSTLIFCLTSINSTTIAVRLVILFLFSLLASSSSPSDSLTVRWSRHRCHVIRYEGAKEKIHGLTSKTIRRCCSPCCPKGVFVESADGISLTGVAKALGGCLGRHQCRVHWCSQATGTSCGVERMLLGETD